MRLTGVKIIVGLGNPGQRYEATRHNIGFCVIEKIGTECGADFKSAKNLFADVAKITYVGKEVIIAKPTTYMNLSGKSFIALKNWYKVSLDDFLVVHDDVSLPLGRVRFQKNSGAGGQHGVESIIELLGGQKNFDRLKIGVGPDPGGDLRANYVLAKFPQADHRLLADSIELASLGVKAWLEKGLAYAMNTYNGLDIAKENDEAAGE